MFSKNSLKFAVVKKQTEHTVIIVMIIHIAAKHFPPLLPNL